MARSHKSARNDVLRYIAYQNVVSTSDCRVHAMVGSINQEQVRVVIQHDGAASDGFSRDVLQPIEAVDPM